MNYWQIFLLLVSTLLGISSLVVNESRGKLKKTFIWISLILMIIVLGISVGISLDESDEKKKDKEDITINFQSTLKKGDTTIEKINLAIDSLKIIQSNSRSIIDSLSKQIYLQQLTVRTSEELVQKNQNIFTKQNDIYNTSDRILNPLFPLWINLKIEIPFETSNLNRLIDQCAGCILGQIQI